MWKKICATLSLALPIWGLLTVPSFAADMGVLSDVPADVSSSLTAEASSVLAIGDCGAYGSNVSWALYDNGTLSITGTGEINYMSSEGAPWYPWRQDITSVTIANGVTAVGSNAFGGLDKMVSVSIPGSVTRIDRSAFQECSSLAAVNIPAGVTFLADTTFQNCKSLTTVALSEGLEKIGISTFAGCSSLTSVELPDGLVEIDNSAFRGCSNLTSIAFPQSVSTLGASVFSQCTALASVSLPDAITVLPYGIFSGCERLASISIPESVTEIGASAFSGCIRLSSVSIPEGVTVIDAYAFDGCENLTSVTLPASLESLGTQAFSWCSNLTRVVFLGNAPAMASSAFDGVDTSPGRFCIYYTSEASGWTAPEWNGLPSACLDAPAEYSQLDENNRNAQGILFSLNEEARTATVGDNSDQENNTGYTGASGGVVVIPDAVVKNGTRYTVIGIGQNAFSDNQFLRELQLGGSISSVDPSAFANCGQFAAFSISGDNRNFSVQDGVLFDAVQYYLYVYPCGKPDAAYTVPDSVKTIGRYAFQGAEQLQIVTVPESVTSIGIAAFAHCTGIREITLPFIGGSRTDSESFWYIWEFNARESPAVETVVITDEGLKGSDFGLYRYDTYPAPIRSITLPFCGNSIPEYSFENCSGLDTLIFNDVGTIMEHGCLVIPGQISAIGGSAFRGCDAIRQVTIPSSVVDLDERAFGLCTGLESFSVAEDNLNYSSDAWGVLFSKDHSELIQYPSSRLWPYYNVPGETQIIRSYAFHACKNLVNLYIPETVSTMMYAAVDQCPGVTLCVKLDSKADEYAKVNNLTAWYIENYTLQGIELYSLPEKTVYAMGEEDFSGLYVAARFGGKLLQAENYSLSYNPKQSGVQTVTVSYGGQSAAFDILLYDAQQEHLLTFDGVSVPAEGVRSLIAVYDKAGRMVDMQTAFAADGQAYGIVSSADAGQLAEAKLFQLTEVSWVPISAPLVLSSPDAIH